MENAKLVLVEIMEMQLQPMVELVIITIVDETMAFIQITSLQSILVTADHMVVVSEVEILAVVPVVVVVGLIVVVVGVLVVAATFKNLYCILLSANKNT